MDSKPQRFKLDEVKQRFRLTSTEIRVAAFVVAAFVLGLITKCYRETHSSPTPVENHPGRTAMDTGTSKKEDQTRVMKLREPAR